MKNYDITLKRVFAALLIILIIPVTVGIAYYSEGKSFIMGLGEGFLAEIVAGIFVSILLWGIGVLIPDDNTKTTTDERNS